MQASAEKFEGLTERRRVPVVSLLVDACNYETAIARIAELVAAGDGGYVCCATVHMAMEALDDSTFREIVNSASMVTPDGMPLVWMQRLQGKKEASQVRGPSLMPKLLAFATGEGLTVGFHGGSAQVLAEVQKRATAEFPGLEISYILSPPFRQISTAEDAEIIAKINGSKTQILFVGLGCPKQERWMAAHRSDTNAVMIGVGAAFDFYSGTAAESPEWLRNLGLEWFFRLVREPKRLWRRYLILNPRFIWHALHQLITNRTKL